MYLTFKKRPTIPADCDIVFVADAFIDDIIGGAELSSDALIKASPYKVHTLHSRDVDINLLEKGVDKFWIFGNFSALDLALIPTIVANMTYSIIEYDYKYCRYRSPEKHEANEGSPCNCHTEQHGLLISAFMQGAKSLWWMSEKQKAAYEAVFPFLTNKTSTVLSSVFDEETFALFELMRANQDVQKQGWIVLGSPSWVKGADLAETWCKEQGHKYEVVWGVDYHTILDKLVHAEGFAYLPRGRDTCPRMVIEAKLLGCKLHLNDHVQHATEEWFMADDLTTLSYLYMARQRFWNGIKSDMSEPTQTLSGYTTTFNCIDADYPYKECIASMLGFCDQVVVVDAGSTDGTWEYLTALAATDQRLVVHRCVRDRSTPRWAIDFDGKQKALARSLCTSAFCWQQDCDEIVDTSDYQKIRELVTRFPRAAQLICLPVIEYWGSRGKVRADVHNWKWRLSRNVPGLTHGIPAELRRFDADGRLYAAPGSDSCDYVMLGDYSRVPHMNFYTSEIDALRRRAFDDEDEAALIEYEEWYNEIVKHLPAVHHYSWFNVARKARTYRTFWSDFWTSMYGAPPTAKNMWFDKPWDHVTDSELVQRAHDAEDLLGGWVFHRPIDLTASVPHITCVKDHPAVMQTWIARNARSNVGIGIT